MRALRLILPLAFARACLAGAPAAEPLGLDDAIARGLAGNRELASAAHALGLAELAVADARDAFAFTWRPEGGAAATDNGTTTRLGLGLARRTATGASLDAAATADDLGPDAAVRRAASMHVELRQPLLRGRGSLAALDDLRSAESGRLTARRAFEQRRAALVLALVQAHQELARLQHQRAYDEQSLARNAQLRRLTQVREKQGRASRVDSLRVEYQYGQAESSLTGTRERLDTTRADLCELLGLPPDAPLEARSGPPLLLDGVAAAGAESLAFSNRLDYAEALQAVAEARRGIRVARQRVLPTVDLVARYGRAGAGATLDDALAFDDETWSVGLAGDSDLYRRAERSSLRRTMIGAATAEEDLTTLEARIRREVQQAVRTYERAVEQAHLDERNLELAADRAKLARRMFELGRGDSFTATDADAELMSAQSQQLENDSAVTVAAFRLKDVTGTLVDCGDDLKPKPAVVRAPGAMGRAE